MIENWWSGKIDWTTAAGVLLERFIATLPKERTFRLALFGSAPLQLTLDRQFLSADIDLFSADDDESKAHLFVDVDTRIRERRIV